MFRKLIILPWWFVFVVLCGTAVLSISYTEGEEHAIESQSSGQSMEGATAENPIEHENSEEALLVQKLKQRLQQLDEREQRLLQRQDRLEKLRKDLEGLAARQAKEAERLTNQATELESKKPGGGQKDRSLIHLIKVYEAMDPDEAAVRIEEMKEELALDILAGIKDKRAALVLAGVKPEKAARLSEGLRKHRPIRTKAR